MSDTRRRGGRSAQHEEEPQQQQLPPLPPPLIVEHMLLMQTQAVQAIGQTMATMQQVENDLNIRYYPCCPSGSATGTIVSPIGEGNLRLSVQVNLVVVLTTELDHALDEQSRARE